MLSQNTIELVRSANIFDVVSKYVTLKRTGSNFTACCPFHDEKSPSFSVSPIKGFFKCFGCGKSGDGIAFVMEKERMQFFEACEKIATMLGIFIEYQDVDVAEIKKLKDEKEELFQVLDWATNKFRDALKTNDEAREYFLNRHFTEETILDWKIGYAPEKFRFITDLLLESGKSINAIKAGLMVSKENRNHDFFSGRIMIPIEDNNGRVIGFGGRIFKKEITGPKYLNSSENLVYNKSKVLFGLSRAANHIRKQNVSILCEGYTDVIRLHEIGLPVAVASCGTALTADHVKLLKKYSTNIILARDPDKAGQTAIVKDLELLIPEGFNTHVISFPDGQDPDDYFFNKASCFDCDEANENPVKWRVDKIFAGETITDGIIWRLDFFPNMITPLLPRDEVMHLMMDFLLLIRNQNKRDTYTKYASDLFKMKFTELKKIIEHKAKSQEKVTHAEQAKEDGMPGWVNPTNIFSYGFDQLKEAEKGYRIGMYFKTGSIERSTNFTIDPMYHIMDQYNNRRVVEIWNGRQRSITELPTRAMTALDAFESCMMEKGSFYTEDTFNKKYFKKMIAWLSDSFKKAFEIKTLGWQPEGFFAFSDQVYHEDRLLKYNDMGVVEINDINYISIGISSLQKEYRQENNSYENDLYLKYVPTAVTFEQWSTTFCRVYPNAGPIGIAFALITVFKDLISHITKIPHLYCYGTKGSGKSEFAESLTWLFFSGKNADGKLIQGFNLNPGQSTVFSFFSRLERFRNCPALFNEFDENMIEPYKFGAFKAAYDGEGREVGDGESGKTKKTKIQKVQCTCILVGQWLSVGDDGSLLSRSLPTQFDGERVKHLTEEDRAEHRKLKEWEEAGISGIITELLKHREYVKSVLKNEFFIQYKKLTEDSRARGITPESRILKNYTICSAIITVFSKLVILPFTAEFFYNYCLDQVVHHNRMLKDNSSLSNFWKMVEFMFDQNIIESGYAFDIEYKDKVMIIEEREIIRQDFYAPIDILYMRYDLIYALYSKLSRERTGKKAPDQETLLTYLKDQPYFIGLVTNHSFKDKRTSCYAIKYLDLDIGLVRNNHNTPLEQNDVPITEKQLTFINNDPPF